MLHSGRMACANGVQKFWSATHLRPGTNQELALPKSVSETPLQQSLVARSGNTLKCPRRSRVESSEGSGSVPSDSPTLPVVASKLQAFHVLESIGAVFNSGIATEAQNLGTDPAHL